MAEQPPLRVVVTGEDAERARREQEILEGDQPVSVPAPEAEAVAPEPVQLVEEAAPAGELVVEDQPQPDQVAEQPQPDQVAEQPQPDQVAEQVPMMDLDRLATASMVPPESKGPGGIPAVQVQDIVPGLLSERKPELEFEERIEQDMAPAFLNDEFKDIGGLFRAEIGGQQITLSNDDMIADVKSYFQFKQNGMEPYPSQVEAFETVRKRIMRSRGPEGEALGVQLPYADWSNTATLDENGQEYPAYREAKIVVEKAQKLGVTDSYALKALRDSTPLGVANTLVTSVQTTPYATARFFTEAGNWVYEAVGDLASNGIDGFWNRMGNSAEGRAREISELFETLRADYLPNYRDIKNRQIRDRFLDDRTDELLAEGYDEAEVEQLVQEELKDKEKEPGFYLDDKQADAMYKMELANESFLGNFARVLYEDIGIGLGIGGFATNLVRRSATAYEQGMVARLTDTEFDPSGVIKFKFANMSAPDMAKAIEQARARQGYVNNIISRISFRGNRLKSQVAGFEQIEKKVASLDPDLAKSLGDIDKEMDGLGIDLLKARINESPELAQIEARIKRLANQKVEKILAANKGALPPAFVSQTVRDAGGAAMGYAIGHEAASYMFGTDDAELGGFIGAVTGGMGLTYYIGQKLMRTAQSTAALPSVLSVPGRGAMAVEEVIDLLTGKTADFLEKRGITNLSQFLRNPIMPQKVKDPITGNMRRPTVEEKRYFERLNKNFMKIDDRIMSQYLPRLTAYQKTYTEVVDNMPEALREEVSDLLAISLIDRMEFTGLQAAYASATSTIRYQDVFKAGKTMQELSLAILEQEQKAQRLAGVNERLSKILAGELGDLPPSVREQFETILASSEGAVDGMAKEASKARIEVGQIQKDLLDRLDEPDAFATTTPQELEDVMKRIVQTDKIINGEEIYKTVEGARARLSVLFNQVATNRADILTSEGNILNLGESTPAKRLEAEEKIAAGAEQLLQIRQQELVERGIKIYEPIRGDKAPVLDATTVLRPLIEQFGEEKLAPLKFFSDNSIVTTTVPGRQLIRDLNTNSYSTLMESEFVKRLVEQQVKQGGPADPKFALEEFFNDPAIMKLILDQDGSGWDGRAETVRKAYSRVNYAQKLYFLREVFPSSDLAKQLFDADADLVRSVMPTFDLEAGALENVRQFASTKASRTTDPLVKTRMNNVLNLVDDMYKDAGDVELPDGTVGNLFEFIQGLRKDYQFYVGIPTAKGSMLERFESALQERPMRPDLDRPVYKGSADVMTTSLGGSVRDIFLSDNPAAEASNFLAMFRQLYGEPKKLPGYDKAVADGASEADLSKYITYELDPNSDKFKEILPQIQAIATVGYVDAAGMKYVLKESGEIIATPKVFGDNPFHVQAKRGVELLEDKETLAEAQKRLMIPGTDIPLIDLNKLVEARNQYILRMDTSDIKKQYEDLKAQIGDLFEENQAIAKDIEKNRVLSTNDRMALLEVAQARNGEEFFKNVIANPTVGVAVGPDKIKNGILAARDALAKEIGNKDRANAAMAKLIIDGVLSQGGPRAAEKLAIKGGKYTSSIAYDNPAQIFQILEDKDGMYKLKEVLTDLGMDEKRYDALTGLFALQTVMKSAEDAGGISMTKIATMTDSSIISRAFSWWRGQIGTEFLVAQAGFQYMAERKMSFVKFMLETKDNNTIDVLHQVLTGKGDDLSADQVKTFGLVMWSHIIRETQDDPEVIGDTLDAIAEGTYTVGVGAVGLAIED